MIPSPPPLSSLPAGTRLHAGLGFATILADMDFETRSEAGYVWNEQACDWDCLPSAPGNKKGIGVVGAAVYATHPSTDILSLKYNLKDGRGPQWWRPGLPLPLDLFACIAAGGLIEAHNSGFEHWIWQHVAVPLYGFPPLPQRQLRCSMAKARAYALPAALDKLGDVLQLKIRKDKDGDRLLKKFSIPRKPTKNDPRRWITPDEDPEDAERLYRYNEIDIESESEASSMLPDLIPDELEYWLCDQEINYRGVAVDAEAIADCIAIVDAMFAKYNSRLAVVTDNVVTKGSQTLKLSTWLQTKFGIFSPSMDDDAVQLLLESKTLHPVAREALELRSKVGSASIKKLFTIRNQMSKWNRIHDLINFHAARTGRDGGKDVQTQNLPKAGPDVFLCACGHWFGAHRHVCPWCGDILGPDAKPDEWTAAVYDDAFEIIATRSLDVVEQFFGDASQFVIGCLRGLFIAAPGHDLITSDYSAIEAVVTAAMAGCDWRLEAFRTGKDIYLVSIARVTGNTYEFYMEYKSRTGKHHPHRQLGKILELALGYGGWIGSIISFGGDKYMNEAEMRTNILAWRGVSPEIPEMWGGQFRGNPFRPETVRAEYYGLEGAAIQAILHPGQTFTFHAPHADARPVSYFVKADVLHCILPSGRPLAYHRPRLIPASKGPWCPYGALSITFWGWNTNPKMGPIGWVCMDTYGGKLAENVVQAVARDILRDAVVRFRDTVFKVVLRVHDEIVAEVAKGMADLGLFERIMSIMPWWAQNWPIIAKGGWIGLRYRKD